MTALLTLFALTTFGLLAYYYAPRDGEPPWYPERFRSFPSNDPGPSAYDMHRQIADLEALRAREEKYQASSTETSDSRTERSTHRKVA
ncbi:hypothetical protein [Nocardia asteroides]|uniref:hypothetical protein n=1 Tax=Nocardia asteroides TaxID=1824 RepID=UPI001E3D7DF3|nr:hypothetical protein [Nocardia asteroides]UGT58966.1 hypothetical protein LTT61_16820 [Nocardia asteroides]